MTITHTITIGDLISAGSFLTAAAGLFFTWVELRRNGRQRRGEYISGLFSDYLKDPETADIFYRIEYDHFEYSTDMHESAEEIKLDKLLANFDRIAALYEMGSFQFRDLQFMEYEFIRVTENQSVRRYFAFLDHWFASQQIPGPAFPSLRRAAKLLRNHRQRPR